MPKAIRVSFIGHTETKPSRYRVTDGDRIQYFSKSTHESESAAAHAFITERGWFGEYAEGWLEGTADSVFIRIGDSNVLQVADSSTPACAATAPDIAGKFVDMVSKLTLSTEGAPAPSVESVEAMLDTLIVLAREAVAK